VVPTEVITVGVKQEFQPGEEVFGLPAATLEVRTRIWCHEAAATENQNSELRTALDDHVGIYFLYHLWKSDERSTCCVDTTSISMPL
jgi:hypothetical protein